MKNDLNDGDYTFENNAMATFIKQEDEEEAKKIEKAKNFAKMVYLIYIVIGLILALSYIFADMFEELATKIFCSDLCQEGIGHNTIFHYRRCNCVGCLLVGNISVYISSSDCFKK